MHWHTNPPDVHYAMHTTKNPSHQEKLTMHANGTQIPIPEELESQGTDPKELDPSDTDS